ncbi:hypothetical protein M011DRAFT_394737 [Sporormia fimetaria CBS 119925]|uniref:Uncharacterized protein n=1 Tax=Sporormia fimetaria CBS 119925 TaxID=1340428 RepID=A0A6A6VP14_9PLEO|nr:hypothetical protein M011DRAFT_394737 [Sporormia fimetaria CBS 119925]
MNGYPSTSHPPHVPEPFENPRNGFPAHFYNNAGPTYRTEQEKAVAESVLENLELRDDAPPEQRTPTPAAMASQLMEHQKIALKWLIEQEEEWKGGIVADEMGLGKTVEAISLIISRPAQDQIQKTTLVVAPVSLMWQWEKEIARHIRPEHRLKVLVYHNKEVRKTSYDELRTYDVIVTTYGTLASEYKKKIDATGRFANAKQALLGPNSKWYRVILDEAHNIKNKDTVSSKAAADLVTKYRWCMTGTPMMNSLLELFGLVRFMRINLSTWLPCSDFNTFKVGIQRAITRPEDMQRLQVLLKKIMLRRLKTTIIDGKQLCDIPPKEIKTHPIILTEEERETYDNFEDKMRHQVSKDMNNMALFSKLLRMAQICDHKFLIMDLAQQAATDSIEDKELTARARNLEPAVVSRLKGVFQTMPECFYCSDVPVNPTIFVPCGHFCCGDCFLKGTDSEQAVKLDCYDPQCRAKIDAKHITDYKHFCWAHCPEEWQDVNPEGTPEQPLAEDSDSDDDESDRDDVKKEEDVDEHRNLAGFVVADDVDDDDEAQGGSTTTTTRVTTPADPSTAPPARPTMNGTALNGATRKPKRRKLTLAELKKESLKNRAAKERYIRKLRKIYKPSSKINTIIDILSVIRSKDHKEKTLIFSQWTSMLDLLEIPLQDGGYKFQRYDGSMKPEARALVVANFTDDDTQTILLISLKAGNAGLNLNMASQVILVDPFWNPYIEDQAVDRAHRMPQKRVVQVHRLLTEDSIEDRIVSLQEEKREMIGQALGEGGSQGGGLTRRDIMRLFGFKR